MSQEQDLGPMPDPEIEPGEPNPGGVDAEPAVAVHTTPDPPLTDNPEIAQKVPDPVKQEVGEGEDTSTKATRDEGGTEADGEPQKESPA